LWNKTSEDLSLEGNECGRIRGCIKGLKGDYEGGLKDLDQALNLKASDVLALVDRGVFRFLGGDYIGALADLDEAIKHEPAQPPEILKLRDAIAKVSALQFFA
jgi:tetratricopeptide (TPR) repeat protein